MDLVGGILMGIIAVGFWGAGHSRGVRRGMAKEQAIQDARTKAIRKAVLGNYKVSAVELNPPALLVGRSAEEAAWEKYKSRVLGQDLPSRIDRLCQRYAVSPIELLKSIEHLTKEEAEEQITSWEVFMGIEKRSRVLVDPLPGSGRI